MAGGLVATSASAGPPLSIGDPGVLEPGRWEVIAAATTSSIGNVDFSQLPLLDISLGLLQDRLQVAAVYPYAFVDPDTGPSNWDFGNLELGLTWRIWDTQRLQLAFAPAYSFGVTRTTAEQGIGSQENVASLPVVGEFQINDRWRLNTSVGYLSVQDGGDRLSYGMAVAYGLNARWELLLELAGGADTGFDNDVLDLRPGFDYAVTEDFHLLFSAATGLRASGEEDKLDYDVFIAFQLTI